MAVEMGEVAVSLEAAGEMAEDMVEEEEGDLTVSATTILINIP